MLVRSPDLKAGFTLLELLVVLTVLGLLAALALPNFARIFDRFSFAIERENVERKISLLPYQAYREQRNYVLVPQSDIESDDKEVPANLRSGPKPLADPVSLDLPNDWRLQLQSPILYRKNGVCLGGAFDLIISTVRYRYELAAPHCQPRLVGGE